MYGKALVLSIAGIAALCVANASYRNKKCNSSSSSSSSDVSSSSSDVSSSSSDVSSSSSDVRTASLSLSVTTSDSSGTGRSNCPFEFGSSSSSSGSDGGGGGGGSSRKDDSSIKILQSQTPTKHPKVALSDYVSRNSRVIGLYDIYIHLPLLQEIWISPVCKSKSARFEPYFAAGLQGIECMFLLLADFSTDSRGYVVKIQKLELVCKDILVQFQLFSELIDGQFDKDVDLISLPTIKKVDAKAHMPSSTLSFVTHTLRSSMSKMTAGDRESFRKLLNMVCVAYYSYFGSLAADLGIRGHIDELAHLAGSVPVPVLKDKQYAVVLDYNSIVKPGIYIYY